MAKKKEDGVVLLWTVRAVAKETRDVVGHARYEGEGWTLAEAIIALSREMEREINAKQDEHNDLLREMKAVEKETYNE